MLDAEIQALAAPDASDLDRTAKEAVKSYKELRDAVHEADRVVRERLRTGRNPSPATAGIELELTVKPNGERDVRRSSPARTPEQIARGQQPAPAEPEA